MHYYQFNIGDYRKDTAHLSPIEHYIYRQLIDWYHLDEKPIPKITQSVMRRLSLGSEHEPALNNVLQDFFVSTKDGWRHGRIDREINNYHEMQSRNKVNGAKGGRPRNQHVSDDVKPKITQSVSSGLPKETECKGNKELETKELETKELETKELETKDQEILKPLSPPVGGNRLLNNQIDQIFDYWVKITNRTDQTKLTAKRRQRISARLKEGYGVDQIKQAIDGCLKSPHHMGQNDTGTVYDDIELICRSGEKLEQFSNNVAKLSPVSKSRPQPETFAQFDERVSAQVSRIKERMSMFSFEPVATIMK